MRAGHTVAPWAQGMAITIEPLQPLHPLWQGMAITIEPGLYFPTDDPDLPDWCKGIGIRIEDDLIVNARGEAAEVLTSGVPKDADGIEEMLAGHESR